MLHTCDHKELSYNIVVLFTKVLILVRKLWLVNGFIYGAKSAILNMFGSVGKKPSLLFTIGFVSLVVLR